MGLPQKYLTIAEELEKKILSHKLKEFPDYCQLTEKFNITRRTAGKIVALLKKKGLIAYQPGIGNRLSLVKNNIYDHNKKKIIIAISPVRDYTMQSLFYNNELLRGLSEYCIKNQLLLRIYSTDNLAAHPGLFSRETINRVLGIFYNPHHYAFDKKIIDIIKKNSLPAVSNIFCREKSLVVSTVSYQEQDVLCILHKNVNPQIPVYLVSLRDKKEPWIRKREILFGAYFRERGTVIRLKKKLSVADCNMNKFIRIGYITAKKLYDEMRFPCAIIGINDAVARGVMKYLLKRKIKIPETASIAGIDCNILITRDLISSVEINRFRMGYEAARLLHKKNREMKTRAFQVKVPVVFKKGITG
ncbi:MAG TPA: hypothetical protein DC049_14790 [Spirochaetia bacterium]|nr:hypothetical protein [Spirochaetia bacterium]